MEHPGRIGKYEVEQLLGGGMAQVYRAKDTVLGRRVALKLLTDAALANPDARAKFLQEARLASNIQHDNIVSIFDFGEDAGRPFLVMEYVEGESLRAAIEAGRAGDTAERIRIARQAARALEYIHSRKVVHRDLKPENIHIDRSGKVRLMDFGIAGASGAKPSEHSGTGQSTAGTPFYMAPEQVLGRPLTTQADVYSFGVVLYELFTGRKPFHADTVEKIFEQILYQPLDVQPLVDAQLPRPVIDVITRCTSKKLVERSENMSSVVAMLEQAAATNPAAQPMPPAALEGILSPSGQRPESQVRLSMPPPPGEQQHLSAQEESAATTAASQASNTFLWVAGGAIAVALVIYAVVVFTR